MPEIHFRSSADFKSLTPALVSEFIGTYFLCFTVGCNVLTGSPVWAATSIACVLMVLVYALGDVSGANLNPAVSLALGISKKLDWAVVGMYVLMQLLAGICACFTYRGMFRKTFTLGPLAPFNGYNAMGVEFLYTFMLCFVVLNCAASTKNTPNRFFGLAIGFVIVAGGYAAGPVSGGALNPAVALGIDITSTHLGFGWAFWYICFELLGACFAAVMFRLVRPDDFDVGVNTSPYGIRPRVISEFIGTYMLVLTVGLNVLGGSPLPAWSIAASLMCMIYALGNVSGGHFNPAVTIAVVASGRGKIDPKSAGMYVGAQLMAGLCASISYAGVHAWKAPDLGPADGFGVGSVGAAEILFTFLLCFVVLSVATVERPEVDIVGLAIGLCVVVGGTAGGAVGAGSLNPAVSFGIAVGSYFFGKGSWLNCFVFTLAELMGAVLAAGLLRMTHASEFGAKV